MFFDCSRKAPEEEARLSLSQFDSKILAEVRKEYESGSGDLADLAHRLGLSQKGFYQFRKAQGWPLRKRGRPKSPPSQAKPHKPTRPARTPHHRDTQDQAVSQNAGAESFDTGKLTKTLHGALTREIIKMQKILNAADAPGAERNARVLASLLKALGEVRKYETSAKDRAVPQGQSPHAAAPRPARDLAMLRAELARRLDELRRSQSSG